MSVEPEAELAALERLAGLLDARFRIPFTPVRFGVDLLVGLVPEIGDALALGANVALDGGVVAASILGDVFVAFKSNRRNMALLRRR